MLLGGGALNRDLSKKKGSQVIMEGKNTSREGRASTKALRPERAWDV